MPEAILNHNTFVDIQLSGQAFQLLDSGQLEAIESIRKQFYHTRS